MNWKKTLLICVLILLSGGVIVYLIFSSEPTADSTSAAQETAMLVDVIEAQRGTYRPAFQSMGTVRPAQDITLSPRVSGQVIQLSSNFTPGSYVEEGDTLLQIDPSDYENTLQQRQSEEQQAVADLEIEMGRQNVARQDYELLEDTLTGENKSLVLREPQLNAARSAVQSARAAVKQAELDLQRTTIEAPFDAHIISRNTNVGSQVGPGDEVGRLVGLEEYWVEATMPQSQLRWLNFTENGNSEGSEVQIHNRTAWQPEENRTGYLFRLIGALENETRMARLLISVPDPLGYEDENKEHPPLIIDSFVEANIKGEELQDVIRLNRDYIRENNTVWLMEEERLRIREVEIILRDAQYAYISEGIAEQDQIVTTNLSTVSDGARLRLEETTDTTAADTLSGQALL